MKTLRLVLFVIFGICAFCLPVRAQKTWTYKGDNGATSDMEREEITAFITRRPNGYEVSGTYSDESGSCILRGSYFPEGQRLRATCVPSRGEKREVTGFKLAEKDKDAFQVRVEDGGELVAWRDGIKPKTTESSKSACGSPAGTWNWWNGTVVTFSSGGTVHNNTGLTGNWRLEGGYVNVSWSNGVQGHYVWVGDGNTLSETYNGRQETMHREGQCGNQTSSSSASTHFNLGGSWTAHWGDGGVIGAAAIDQQGDSLTFYDLCCGKTSKADPHNKSRGHFEGSDTVIAEDWGGAGTGQIKDNGRRINWSNGTYWIR